MKDANLIHLKFEYEEAKSGKKDILSSELNILNIINSIKNYKKLRIKELKNKEKIRLKIKSLIFDITRLEKLLPKIKIPKILKKETQKVISVEESKSITKYGTVEEQLREIQRKLKELEID